MPNNTKVRKITKWIICVVTACILIYLALRHLDAVADGLAWLANILFPILLGIIIALVLNVPMRPIERHLYPNSKNKTVKKLRRPLAIALALILVLGIFVGIAFLVLPEIGKVIRLIAQIMISGIDHAALWEETIDFSEWPFGEYLSQIDVDWMQLKDKLEGWTQSQGDILVKQAAGAVSSIAKTTVNFFIGLVFSIYVLANKEKLKKQILRLVHVWLPEKPGTAIVHIASVCAKSFSDFIAGQAMEALILGTLCTIGMLILHFPYAPMIGALVGVTALIPIIGAYTGAIVGAILIATVSPLKGLAFIVFIFVLQQIEGNLIYPRVVGSKINLPAIWVFAAVTIGGNLAGPIGMLLGVPAASAAYALLKEATSKREKAKMKSTKTDSE